MTGPKPATRRQRAVQIARVLRIEIEQDAGLDLATRRDMLDTIDDLIASLVESRAGAE